MVGLVAAAVVVMATVYLAEVKRVERETWNRGNARVEAAVVVDVASVNSAGQEKGGEIAWRRGEDKSASADL